MKCQVYSQSPHTSLLHPGTGGHWCDAAVRLIPSLLKHSGCGMGRDDREHTFLNSWAYFLPKWVARRLLTAKILWLTSLPLAWGKTDATIVWIGSKSCMRQRVSPKSWSTVTPSCTHFLEQPGILPSKSDCEATVDGENPVVDVIASGLGENWWHHRLDWFQELHEAKNVSEELIDSHAFLYVVTAHH